MTDKDRPRFAVLMKGLAETFDKAPSKERQEIYFRVLQDLTIEQVEEGITRLLRERTITSTLPVPGEIRKHLGGGKTAAMLALDTAEQAIEKHGAYRSVQFDDPVIHMVVARMGGWAKFCNPWAYGETQEWHWRQKEFMAFYEAFAQNPRQECPTVLAGVCALDGRDDPPQIIGNPAKVIEWTTRAKQLPAGRPSDTAVSALVGSVLGGKAITEGQEGGR